MTRSKNRGTAVTSKVARTRAAAPQALAASLQELGFTDYEARTYIALAQSHPATAYEVALRAGLPRANVYSVLRALEGRGAIQPVSEDPVKYAPIDPERFFSAIRNHTGSLCDSVVATLKRHSTDDDDLYMWVARGEREVRSKLLELIGAARQHVWIKALDSLIEPLLPALSAAAERRVSVKLIAFGENVGKLKIHPGITVFPHEGDAKPPGTAVDVLLTMAVDLDGIMIASHAREVVGSYTRNHSITYVIQTLLLHEIYLAEIFADIGPMLEQKYGKRLRRLRMKHRPAEMGTHLLQ